MGNRKRVLILCTANSARSQMGEGLLRQLAGEAFEVVSAGTIRTSVRPAAIAVMREIGVDISTHRSKSVEEFAGQEFDYVITVCDSANESCPVFPARTKRIHWSIEDPAEAIDEDLQPSSFRAARGELKKRLQDFVAKEAPVEKPGP